MACSLCLGGKQCGRNMKEGAGLLVEGTLFPCGGKFPGISVWAGKKNNLSSGMLCLSSRRKGFLESSVLPVNHSALFNRYVSWTGILTVDGW